MIREPEFASTWTRLDPQYKDRELWWRCLWIAHLTRLRTGRHTSAGERLGPTGPIARHNACCSSHEYAHQLYLERGGRFTQYVPRRQRARMSTAGQDATLPDMANRKNPHAVGLGKLRAALASPGEMSEIGEMGGLAGGPARAEALSPRRRSEIARLAAEARWGKKKRRPKAGD